MTMPLLVPPETRSAVGGDGASHVESRPLYFDRYADPRLKDDGHQTPRRNFFNGGLAKPPAAAADFLSRQRSLLLDSLKIAPADLLFARNEARLLLNMAGGVMENAGLCLHRFSGLPFIPGNAVKGCARRATLAALREWVVVNNGTMPTDTSNNPLASACAIFATPEEMLAAIARVFGWSDAEWNDKNHKKSGTPQSDFRWACGDDRWREIRHAVRAALWRDRFGDEPFDEDRGNRTLKQHAGSVAFLPAYPWSEKAEHRPTPDLELDVVTCHHPDYYQGKLPVATDTENPIPVVFPAVAPGHVFAFAVLPLRGCNDALRQHARTWLKTGLEVFGLGAKTAAGYGWFSDVSKTVIAQLAKDEAEVRAVVEKAAQQKAEAARLSSLPAPERFKAELLKLDDQKFAEKGKLFASLGDEERRGYLLALCDPAKKETRKGWRRKKPENLRPWIDYGASLNPRIVLPEP
jgi:CRISPR type III-B/RAMP module RAMP protein Cmr6